MQLLKKLFSRGKDKGSYGKAIVLLSSDPAEIERISDALGEEYKTVMELEELENHDFSKVIVRKEAIPKK